MKRLFFSVAPDQRGAVTVFIAVLLPALMGMAALVLDLSHGWETRRLLQNCADAAALAGAQELPESAMAIAWAEDYLYDPAINNGRCLGASDPAPLILPDDRDLDGVDDTIRVVLYRNLATTFGRLLGSNVMSVEVAATAIKGDVTGLKGLEPFAMLACGPDTNGDGQPDCPYVGTCPVDINQLYIRNWNPLTDTAIVVPVVAGWTYTVKLGGGAGPDDINPGNFQAIDLGAAPGTQDYRHNVEYGTDEWKGDCELVETKTGALANTRQGLYTENRPMQSWNPSWPDDNHVSRVNRDVSHTDLNGNGVLWDDVLLAGDGHGDPFDCPRIMYVPFIGNLVDGGGGTLGNILTFGVMFLEDLPVNDVNNGYVKATFLDVESRLFPPQDWSRIGSLDPDSYKPTGVKLIR